MFMVLLADVGLNIANSKARAALLSLSDNPRPTRIDHWAACTQYA